MVALAPPGCTQRTEPERPSLLLRLTNGSPPGRWVTVSYGEADQGTAFLLEHAPTRWSELLADELRLEHNDFSTKDIPCSYTEVVRLTLRPDHSYTLETVGRHNLEKREDLKKRQTGVWKIVDDAKGELALHR